MFTASTTVRLRQWVGRRCGCILVHRTVHRKLLMCPSITPVLIERRRARDKERNWQLRSEYQEDWLGAGRWCPTTLHLNHSRYIGAETSRRAGYENPERGQNQHDHGPRVCNLKQDSGCRFQNRTPVGRLLTHSDGCLCVDDLCGPDYLPARIGITSSQSHRGSKSSAIDARKSVPIRLNFDARHRQTLSSN
jgi:hypothetical protein